MAEQIPMSGTLQTFYLIGISFGITYVSIKHGYKLVQSLFQIWSWL